MSEARELVLQDPVEFAGETVTMLRLREPRGRDVRALKGDPSVGDLMDIGARIAGVDVEVVNRLSARDALALASEVGSFFPQPEGSEASGT